ncbi:hypothetical protein B4N89_34880 [Embleya scabrispora]|uniref:Uncharacterized protein n=1 Tax=Embleya scabrispora TaxID=159449 RepID=A0A1T3NQT6_9ACTN|nr:hypothetical protein [Embleya scabrispora]OPC79247.1 hypothetical protein B4N89_34880 [Embleya scabrispora]
MSTERRPGSRRNRVDSKHRIERATARRATRHNDGASVPAMSSEVIEAALYRAAEGDFAAQATTYILTEEGSFVRRPDLYAVCLDWSDDGRYASVRWETLREVVTAPDGPYHDGALRTILLLCCSLHDDGPAPLSRLASLDTTNARIVSRGVHIATGALPLRQALGNTP